MLIIRLDLNKYVNSSSDEYFYDLKSVCNHHGTSFNGGHCNFDTKIFEFFKMFIYYFKLKDTAFAKNENKWFEYNDEIYNEISENNLVVNQNKRIFLVSLSFST